VKKAKIVYLLTSTHTQTNTYSYEHVNETADKRCIANIFKLPDQRDSCSVDPLITYHPQCIVILGYMGEPFVNSVVNTPRIARGLDTKQCRRYWQIAAREVIFHRLRNYSVCRIHQQPTANQLCTISKHITFLFCKASLPHVV